MSTGKWVMLAVFVNDLLITGTDTSKIKELKIYLGSTFEGQATWEDSVNSFLGIEIHYDLMRGELSMEVTAKVNDFFEKHEPLASVHGSNVPYLACFNKLDDPEPELTTVQVYIKEMFPTIAGSLIYLTIAARPDLTPIVNSACKGMHDPQFRHIAYLEAAIKYLKNHRDSRFVYKRSGSNMNSLYRSLSYKYPELRDLPSCPIVTFSDASHMSNQRDKMRSTTGTCIFVHGSLVQWSFKMQPIAAGSSMESELIAASASADKAVWFYNLSETYPFLFGLDKPVAIPLLIDNLACLSVTNHPSNSTKARHVALREFRVRDFHELGKIRPFWCPGKWNVADFFSKLLQKNLFELNLSRIGIVGSHFIPKDDCSHLPAYHTVEMPIQGQMVSINCSDQWLDRDSFRDWEKFHETCGMSITW